jgi:hydrogenase-4 component B
VGWLAGIALAGAVTLALGGIVAALPGRLRVALTVQAVGMAALGVAGMGELAGGHPAGAPFRSGISPALGLDGLSGFFLVVLAVTAVPTLVFARGYLDGAAAGHRAVGALTAAFLLAPAGVLASRDVTTFLAFWELMTLVPVAAILTARRDAPVRDIAAGADSH